MIDMVEFGLYLDIGARSDQSMILIWLQAT